MGADQREGDERSGHGHHSTHTQGNEPGLRQLSKLLCAIREHGREVIACRLTGHFPKTLNEVFPRGELTTYLIRLLAQGRQFFPNLCGFTCGSIRTGYAQCRSFAVRLERVGAYVVS